MDEQVCFATNSTCTTCAKDLNGDAAFTTMMWNADSFATWPPSCHAFQSCSKPSNVTGYDLSSASENLRLNEFEVTGVRCAVGYGGRPTATACTQLQWDANADWCDFRPTLEGFDS